MSVDAPDGGRGGQQTRRTASIEQPIWRKGELLAELLESANQDHLEIRSWFKEYDSQSKGTWEQQLKRLTKVMDGLYVRLGARDRLDANARREKAASLRRAAVRLAHLLDDPETPVPPPALALLDESLAAKLVDLLDTKSEMHRLLQAAGRPQFWGHLSRLAGGSDPSPSALRLAVAFDDEEQQLSSMLHRLAHFAERAGTEAPLESRFNTGQPEVRLFARRVHSFFVSAYCMGEAPPADFNKIVALCVNVYFRHDNVNVEPHEVYQWVRKR